MCAKGFNKETSLGGDKCPIKLELLKKLTVMDLVKHTPTVPSLISGGFKITKLHNCLLKSVSAPCPHKSVDTSIDLPWIYTDTGHCFPKWFQVMTAEHPSAQQRSITIGNQVTWQFTQWREDSFKPPGRGISVYQVCTQIVVAFLQV